MSRTIFFLVVVLFLAGGYAAFQVPISVFPETNFPRVVIAVDNGVMPVEQMQVTITKPIEDAVNSVPGLKTVRSTTSRGTAEISLLFDWDQDMFHNLQLEVVKHVLVPVEEKADLRCSAAGGGTHGLEPGHRVHGVFNGLGDSDLHLLHRHHTV